MRTKPLNVATPQWSFNGYAIQNPALRGALLSYRNGAVLRELRGDFAATTGCGEGCKRLLDAADDLLSLCEDLSEQERDCIARAAVHQCSIFIFG